MINNRFALTAFAAAFALAGCVKQPNDQPAPDFSTGATQVTVTHLAARTVDGGPVYITVDGNDAGALATGDSVALHVAAGKHQVGGYARSIIGRVTIPSVQVVTAPDSPKHIAYTLVKNKPGFTELNDAPSVQSQEPKANDAAKPQSAQTNDTTSAKPQEAQTNDTTGVKPQEAQTSDAAGVKPQISQVSQG